MQTRSIAELSNIQISQVSVMLHRHLQAELEQLIQLESIGQAFSKAVEDGGVNGPKLNASQAIASLCEGLEPEAERIRRQRSVILTAINRDRPADLQPLTIRQFIESTDAETKLMLSQLRLQILDRLSKIQASMLGNQAVMFYSHDFNKRMVSGLTGSAVDESQYGNDGQATGIRPGNIIRKVC